MNVNNQKISTKVISLIFFILFLKIGYGVYLDGLNPNFFIAEDTSSYLIPIKEFCENGRYYDTYHNIPETHRTPGLAIFLLPAICFDLNLNIYIVILNSIMILLSAYFTIKITQLMEIKIHPLIVILCYFIEPTLNRYLYMILTEIVFLFWFTFFLYFFVYGLKKNNPFYFFFGFIILTFCTFIRPITFYLPYFLFLFINIIYFFNSSFRTKFKYYLLISSIFGLLFHIIVTQLWVNRNYQVADVREFSTNTSIYRSHYMAASIIAKGEKKSWEEIKRTVEEKYNVLSPQQFSDYSKVEFINSIKKYPFDALFIGIKGAIMTFLSPGTGQYTKLFMINTNQEIMYKIFLSLGFFWLFIMYTFASYGLYKINKDVLLFFIAVIFIYLILVSSGPMSYSRFRIPMTPIMLILMFCGIENAVKKFGK